MEPIHLSPLLIYATTADRLYDRQISQVFYSIYIGSQHIIPPIQGEDLRPLYQLAQRWFEKESE